MKPKYIIVGLVFLFFIMTLQGCSNYSEINNVMIVDGIGIDKVGDKYQVSFNTYIGNEEYQVHDVLVNNIDEAFNNVYLTINKKVYLSHLNILLFSSSLSNKDILNIINTFNNRSELRGSFLVAIVKNYTPNIFKNKNLVSLIENNYKESGVVVPATFNNLIFDYHELEISYIPVINNDDFEISGMHSIFTEYRCYNKNESVFLNLVLNKLNTLVIDIDNVPIKLQDIKISYFIKNNYISILIDSVYISDIEKKKIISYLISQVNNLFDSEINYNYFLDLIKKYDYDYYINNDEFDIEFEINVKLEKENLNNSLEDDLDEKN